MTDETKRPRKPVEIPTDFSVAERRLQHGDLGELGRGADIVLAHQPEPMVTYWSPVNGQPTPWTMINQLGWQYVRPSDIEGRPEDQGLDVENDRIVKGGREDQEVLFKMPQRLREGIAMKKTLDFQARRLSESKHKSMIQKSLTDEGHPEDAEMLAKMEGTLEGGRSVRLARAQEVEPEIVR